MENKVVRYDVVQCENPDNSECLCEACRDFFENGLGLFDQESILDIEQDGEIDHG
jgi:hypothetical protein